jgi:membrane-associated tyrosine/threonine-specific cdc2-inhibitory kinase
LNKYAETHHDIPESVIWTVIVDLLQALAHLHSRKLVHMDIKPDNIFITFDGHYKLGDFGLVIDISNVNK